MANIRNVRLAITPVAGQANQRRVTVTYSINFNAAEELSQTVFKEVVSIMGSDLGPDEHLFKMKSVYVRAQAGIIQRNWSKIVDKSKLDEDDDIGLFGVKIKFDDEVYANVKLLPFVPNSDSANSAEIVRFF